MPNRQWWPSSRLVRTEVADTTLQRLSTGTFSTAALPAKSAASTQGASVPPSIQQGDESLSWQEVFLQKLLPQGSMSAAKEASTTTVATGPALPTAMSKLSSGKHAPKAACPQGRQIQYAGVFLDPLSTARLLAWAPPRHTRLHGDHLSLISKPSLEQLSSLDLGCEVSLSVLARTENAAIQVPFSIPCATPV